MSRFWWALVPVLLLLLSAIGVRTTQASTPWVVSSMNVRYDVSKDGTISATETIAVDFKGLERHGIFRYFRLSEPCPEPNPDAEQPTFSCPSGSDRYWEYSGFTVQDGAGKAWPFESSLESGNRVLKIGDANKLVTGKQTYVISYRVKGALDPYADHDELYWDAMGEWRESDVEKFTLTLALPSGATPRADCFQGSQGATNNKCRASVSGSTVTYSTTKAMTPYDEVTIVAGWQKGIVAEPTPIVKDRPSIDDFFTLDVWEYAGFVLVFFLAMAALGGLWWKQGRDRAYRTLFYLTGDSNEETLPLFKKQPIVVEFTPPDDLRPAQMGLLMDERADTVDVTATLIDLAVRGYLHITEIPKQGWFGSKDWRLSKLKNDTPLLAYERELLDNIFGVVNDVELSDLKMKFAAKLAKVKNELYADGMRRAWFSHRPEQASVLWRFVGLGVAAGGVGLCWVFGVLLQRGLIGAPVVVAGMLLALLGGAMRRRTASGREALRRVLGFRLYIATAETRQQEFNEQANIFARYLPYAITFGLVSKWAKAFEGLEDAAQQSTADWYTGTGAFHVMAFASGLQGFSSVVSSSMSSTPRSSGSGFSGGSSGGGGGGGGGGSW